MYTGEPGELVGLSGVPPSGQLTSSSPSTSNARFIVPSHALRAHITQYWLLLLVVVVELMAVKTDSGDGQQMVPAIAILFDYSAANPGGSFGSANQAPSQLPSLTYINLPYKILSSKIRLSFLRKFVI